MFDKIKPLLDKFKIYRGYPWRHHCLMLLPICLYVIVSGFMYGFFGDGPYAFYRVLRESYPLVTDTLRFITNNYLSIYAVYLIILIRALYIRDKWELQFVLRSVVYAVLFITILTHCMKGITGIQGPGAVGPPRPFEFAKGYMHFPSGHSGAIITAALPLAFWIGKKSVSVILCLALTTVCFSRLWLAAHHPVDVLGSVVVASLAARCIFLPRRPPDETGASGPSDNNNLQGNQRHDP